MAGLKVALVALVTQDMSCTQGTLKASPAKNNFSENMPRLIPDKSAKARRYNVAD